MMYVRVCVCVGQTLLSCLRGDRRRNSRQALSERHKFCKKEIPVDFGRACVFGTPLSMRLSMRLLLLGVLAGLAEAAKSEKCVMNECACATSESWDASGTCGADGGETLGQSRPTIEISLSQWLSGDRGALLSLRCGTWVSFATLSVCAGMCVVLMWRRRTLAALQRRWAWLHVDNFDEVKGTAQLSLFSRMKYGHTPSIKQWVDVLEQRLSALAPAGARICIAGLRAASFPIAQTWW